jgi:hypothetical protein
MADMGRLAEAASAAMDFRKVARRIINLLVGWITNEC